MSEKPPIDGLREFHWPFRNPLDLVAELFCACRWQIGDEEAAYFAATYLFDELRLRIGQEEAKKVFLHAVTKGSVLSEEYEINMLLTRLYLMRDKRTGQHRANVQALARVIREENEAFNKSPKRNGRPARPTNQSSIEKQIIRIRDAHGPAWLAERGLSPLTPKKKKTVRKPPKKRKLDRSKLQIAQR